ncbi:hypothetical protein [Paludisphaera soli]|uniref:hypothetical protein n=1 Tax=Paludisphaera soli TaxID=2712865 RepID=UPI0013EDCE22|nr:hypothetical protein [Paludisphaera soli]
MPCAPPYTFPTELPYAEGRAVALAIATRRLSRAHALPIWILVGYGGKQVFPDAEQDPIFGAGGEALDGPIVAAEVDRAYAEGDPKAGRFVDGLLALKNDPSVPELTMGQLAESLDGLSRPDRLTGTPAYGDHDPEAAGAVWRPIVKTLFKLLIGLI